MRYTYRSIETHWKGIVYRSRLEARWAVFFDEMGYHHEYEPDGVDLEGVWYLPDFRIKLRMDDTPKECFAWAEVKPDEFTSAERGKCSLLSLRSMMPVLMLDGPPSIKAYELISSWSAAAGEVDAVPSLLPCLGTKMRIWHGAFSPSDLEKLGEDFRAAVMMARNERFAVCAKAGRRHAATAREVSRQ